MYKAFDVGPEKDGNNGVDKGIYIYVELHLFYEVSPWGNKNVTLQIL